MDMRRAKEIANKDFSELSEISLKELFEALKFLNKEQKSERYDDTDKYFEPIKIWAKEQTPSKIREFLQEKGIEEYKWTILIPDDYQKDGICDEGYTNWVIKIAHGRVKFENYIIAFLNYDPKLLFPKRRKNESYTYQPKSRDYYSE